MILQALVHGYDNLAQRGELDHRGWLKVRVSWSLDIDEDGKLCRIIPLAGNDEQGKKIIHVASVPETVKRTSGVAPNFLCDNAAYMLGIDSKGNKERSIACFEANAKMHINLLRSVDHPMAKAICSFFQTWNALSAERFSLIKPVLGAIKTGGNIVFSMGDTYAHEVREIQDAWDRSYEKKLNKHHGHCIVTGEDESITLVHPNIQGVMGTRATGAALISFHGDAYESYGRRKAQGLNAPVGERTTFAYSAALNYMLREPAYHICLGNTTMVYWAEDAQKMYSVLIAYLLGVTRSKIDQATLCNTAEKIRNGHTVVIDGVSLYPNQRFYILGLTPNASRIAVQFFVTSTIQNIAQNIHRHQERLKIACFSSDKGQELSLWSVLSETIHNKLDEMPLSNLVGDVVRAILTDSPYPVTLFYQVELCLRGERTITREKAAIIKAYLTKNVLQDRIEHPMKSTLVENLNEGSNYVPYVLGRLFAILELLQRLVIPNRKTNTYGRYFTLACATPVRFFPQMIRCTLNNLEQLDGKQFDHYAELISDLSERLGNTFPEQLSLDEQGIFQLGYYHQKVALCTKESERNE